MDAICTETGLRFEATLINRGECDQERSYRVTVQYKVHGGPWVDGASRTGVMTFPEGETTVRGRFECGVDYPANARMERVVFFLDDDANRNNRPGPGRCEIERSSEVVHCDCGTAATNTKNVPMGPYIYVQPGWPR